jgi:ribosomal protein S27AE
LFLYFKMMTLNHQPTKTGRCARCGISALADRKKNKSKRKFRPSGRPLWSVPAENIPFLSSSNDHLCEQCYFHLRYMYPPAQLITQPARKYRKGELAETLPPQKINCLSASASSSTAYNLSQVKDMTVTIPVAEWVRLVEASPCSSAVRKEMFRTRPGCTGKIVLQSIVTEGKFIVLKTKCDQCGERINFCNSSSQMTMENKNIITGTSESLHKELLVLPP